jgi:SAM-dependent methyltransferase
MPVAVRPAAAPAAAPAAPGEAATPYDDATAVRWDAEVGPVYEPLSRLLVSVAPLAMAGRLVLDAGCGTGSAADAASAQGARVVGADASLPMLRQRSGDRWPATCGDVLRLPFGDGAFDIALAGFVITHVPPDRALAELARVVHSGGAVVASTWDMRGSDPVKSGLEAVLRAHGWSPPTWFRAMRERFDAVAGGPDQLARLAEDVGLRSVMARSVAAELGSLEPATLVAYRLAMPHVAPWFSGLEPARRRHVVLQSRAAVGTLGETWRPRVILLTGRV